jgi:hypothetical protein
MHFEIFHEILFFFKHNGDGGIIGVFSGEVIFDTKLKILTENVGFSILEISTNFLKLLVSLNY